MLALVLMLCLPHLARASDAIYLVDRDRSPKPSEGLWLYIAADGRMVTDSGHTATFQTLSALFTKWRNQGTEPGVTLILHPQLKSNSDLKNVHKIINFLRTHHAFSGITIEDPGTPAEKWPL